MTYEVIGDPPLSGKSQVMTTFDPVRVVLGELGFAGF